jgi:hypothetical protein
MKLPDPRHGKTTLHVTHSKDWKTFLASNEPLRSLGVDSKSSSTVPDRYTEGLLTFPEHLETIFWAFERLASDPMVCRWGYLLGFFERPKSVRTSFFFDLANPTSLRNDR